RIVMIGARRLVLIGERIPVPAEARHAHVHLTAASDSRYVAARRAVHERAALVDERALFTDRQAVPEPRRTVRDRHDLAISRLERNLRLAHCYMMDLPAGCSQCSQDSIQLSPVGSRKR